jgi:SAM-dependent methyltransferase
LRRGREAICGDDIVSFTLTARQAQGIHAFQKAEIERLANDADFARAMSKRPQYSRIGDWLTPTQTKRLLEIGCGPGRYVAMMASLGYQVLGADPISYANWEFLRRLDKVTLSDNVFAEALPYADETFDAVACMGALLYYDDPDKAMSEIHRVLKPGGKLVVRTVSRNNLFRSLRGHHLDPATRNAFTEEELAALLFRNGFNVAETFSFGFYPPVFPGVWWVLINGKISVRAQEMASRLCPARYRTSVNAFATRV